MAGKREQSGLWVSLGIGTSEDLYYVEYYDSTTAPVATGILVLSFSDGKSPGFLVTSISPSIIITAKEPGISYTLKRPKITFSEG